MIEMVRIGNAPIIHQGMCESLGDNINGPSVVERPDWATGPGRFLLWFSHHKGQHIRFAHADDLAGPWQIHSPGVLHLGQTPLAQTRPATGQPAWAESAGQDGLYPHLASPDVWVDDTARCFRMIFHGLAESGEQVSYRAASSDGLDWSVEGDAIALVYLRRFRHRSRTFAMGHSGQLALENPDGSFTPGPFPLQGKVRHVAVLTRGDLLHVLFSRIGDRPERLLHVALDLSGPWPDWRPSGPETELLRPALDWEGADEPLLASEAGATDLAHQLRDPEIIETNGRIWVIYTGGGESALGLAELRLP